MKIKILKKGKKELSFELSETNPAFANAIRRSATNSVSTMAIESVDIIKNNSALYNETLAHRLGMIPLSFDRKTYVLPSECKCKGKGCTHCRVTLVLKKKGSMVIYAKDLKSTDKSVKPVDENMIIGKLFENQEINIEAHAQLGTGNIHAKWQPGITSYEYKDDSKIIFHVDSISALEPKEIILNASKKIENDLSELAKLVK